MLRHRYALPVLSGILLALVFFPFYLSALAFVALAPFFYFAADPQRSAREVFVGGFLVGVVGIGPLVYLSLAQLMLFPDATAFTFFIRASSVPTAIFIGVLFACLAGAYRALHSGSAILNALLGASLYLLIIEAPLFWIFDGYYYGALSHAVTFFSPALFAAALLGAPLISFLLAFGSVALAQAYRARHREERAFWLLPACVAVLWLALFAAQQRQPFIPKEVGRTLSVAVLQGRFEDLLPDATQSDIIIYPFSLSGRITSQDDDGVIGAQFARATPASTVVLWQTITEEGGYYDELAIWKEGEKSNYRKRKLYALSDDYTPLWLRQLGIEKSPYVITPGTANNKGVINGSTVGALICSELHQSELARITAAEVPFILAVGSDSMFPGSLSGNFSLSAARLRAAENAIPLVRANRDGPSAIIHADGSPQTQLSYGQQGVLRAEVSAAPHEITPYARLGSGPLYAAALFSLIVSLALRFRAHGATVPGRSE